jgi:hypothetical protein
MPSYKLSRDLLALSMKQCRLVISTEVTRKYYEPLGLCHPKYFVLLGVWHVLEMWVGGGIIMSYSVRDHL